MEKLEKQSSKQLRSKIFKAITVTFQNHPFSPGRDHKLRSENGTKWTKPPLHGGKGFSIIPNEEARRNSKEAAAAEPTSPKISCMGQIKHNNNNKKKKHITKTETPTRVFNNSASSTPIDTTDQVKKHGSKFQRLFRSKSKVVARRSDDVVGELNGSAPPMGDMRRFASSREVFANFDWKSTIGSDDDDNRRDCYSDVEEDEILIPFSAPMLIGGGGGGATSNNNNHLPKDLKPRKEINLWKRRTMAPPRPLQVNPVLTAK